MSLDAPALLLALGLLLPLVLAFLFRRRRDALRVPSTLLWQAVSKRRSRNRSLAKLQRWLALLACLVAVGAWVIAAARPRVDGVGRRQLFVIDVSASMGGPGNRTGLARAKERVAAAIRSRSANDAIGLIAAGSTPRHLVGPTDEDAELLAALEGLEAEDAGADLDAAVLLARRLIEGELWGQIEVLSDQATLAARGDSGETRWSVPSEHPTPTLHRVDRAAVDNVGISLLTTRALPGPSLAREALVEVLSSAPEARQVELRLSVDGVTLAARELRVEPGAATEARFSLRATAGLLRAEIAPTDGGDNALAQDDQASLELLSLVQLRVSIYAGEASEGHRFFVERALMASGAELLPAFECAKKTPKGVPDAEKAEIVVALDQAPSCDTGTPTLFLATHRGRLPTGSAVELISENGETALKSVENEHPLMQGVDVDELEIQRAWAIPTHGTSRSLLALDGGSVVTAGGAEQDRWVHVGIDPLGSDLVLRVAYPVLVANALSTLRSADGAQEAPTIPREEIVTRSQPESDPTPAGAPSFPVSWSLILAALGAALLSLEGWFWWRGAMAW